MDETKAREETAQTPDPGEPLDDRDIGAGPKGGSGGLGYPTHPEGRNATDLTDETLSEGGRGVDVSGVQVGSGNTRITTTPSLSKPKRKKKAAGS